MITINTFPQRITKNITVLGNRFFHLYLIQGSQRTALFEVGVAPIVVSVIAQLDNLGITPDYLIVSHPHADHITALPSLASHFPNAKIISGAGVQRFVTERQGAGVFKKEDEYAVSFLHSAGVPTNGIYQDNHINLETARIATNDEVIDLGGVKIRLMEVKGHSPGNIIAYIENDKAMLVSDSLGCPYIESKTFFPLFFTGFTRYITTIEKIASFDASLIGLGHSFIVEKGEVASTITTALNCAFLLREFALAHKDNIPKTTKMLLEKYYNGELRLYSPENIKECCDILVRRSLE